MKYTKKELLAMGVKNGQIPKHLYMYCSIDSATKILQSSQIWMSSFDKFNDPFEFSFTLSDDYTQEEFIQWLSKAAKGEYNRSIAQELYSNKAELDNIVKDSIEKKLESYGIKCFTTRPDNLLMWAHYAQNHQGVCFKFDILKDAQFFQDLLPVKYDNTYIQLNYIKEQARVSDILIHKSEEWKYEEEWRVLKAEKSNKLVGFSPDSLVEIILGCKCKDQEEIQNLCSQNGFKNVRFRRTQKARDTYSLCINDLIIK